MKYQPSASIPKRVYRAGLNLTYKVLVEFFSAAERVGGAEIVPWLMAPLERMDGIRRRQDYPQFLRLRKGMPDAFWKGLEPREHYRKMVRDWYEAVGTILFYHRLRLPYWRERFEIVGEPPHLRPEWGTRPMIVTFLHTGQFGLIRYWLRAQGVPTASLVSGMPYADDVHQKFLDLGDRCYGLEGVPQLFYAAESLREMIRFLTPGHVVIMAMEGGEAPTSSFSQLYAGEFPIRVKEGACRIAAQTNAVVFPVSVRRTAPCRFQLKFGRPVPDELIQKGDFSAGTQCLISELWPDVEKDPGEVNWTTLEALLPKLRRRRRSWP